MLVTKPESSPLAAALLSGAAGLIGTLEKFFVYKVVEHSLEKLDWEKILYSIFGMKMVDYQ